MESNWLERAELLIGNSESNKLTNSKVLIVGLGGVGSFAAEFIARAGIGEITIADGDDIDITNINRQLPALHSTIGHQKVDEVGKRLLDINPMLNLTKINEFLTPEKMDNLLSSGNFDYAIDCIDSISPKVSLIKACRNNKVKCVSSMGAGGKMYPHHVVVKDIAKVKGCKLGKRIKERLKKLNINRGVRAVYSPETPLEGSLQLTDGTNFKKSFYGTISYMPAIFGLYAAAEVINFLRKQ